VRRRSFDLCVVLLVCALSASFSLRVYAQARTAKDGVYTAAQAKRGETLYRNQCVACHGAMLEGEDGPPLAGQSFLGAWGRLPLADLVDKIQNTMPSDAPGTLTGPQVADVAAYILQANQFPAGRAELAGN
jgi:mono/diheme cytochrome c family protein